VGCLWGATACGHPATGPGCTPSYGSFGVGRWPPACYSPYSTSAWINRPLPGNPQVDPRSDSIVAALNSHGPPGDKGAGLLNDYDHPIYWAKAGDPVYTIAGCGYSGALNGVTIHALRGMLPGGGSDAHVTVMDQSSNTEYDFWQGAVDDNTQTIGGTACGRLSLLGDGRLRNNGGSDGDGANAANTALYAGQIRAPELEAGVIRHAVAVTVACTNGSYVYPALGSALACGTSGFEPADGQFFQLTYSDAEIDALPVAAWKKVVLHAMRQYGFYADDTFGTSEGHSFDLHFESDKMFEAFGYEDPFVTYATAHLGQEIYQSGGAYYYQIGEHVDWSRVRVLKPCVIQRTC
jgi:hypothetical protein